MKAVKGIIERLRAAGKTESEISGIIKQASEKATVKGESKIVELPKVEIKPFGECLKDAIKAAGVTTEDAMRTMTEYEHKQETELRKQTNNWRRMHGLPMRRKRRVKGNGKGKRAGSHPKDTDVS